MKMIVGLGNPGNEYSMTRHNVGFMVIDELAALWKLENFRFKNEALVAEYRQSMETILLVKPQTYMNLSGVAVGAISRFYKIPTEDIIVIYDDMDIEPGKLRVRTKGSSGGHKGIESILVHLGTEDFIRIRFGIGRPRPGQQVVNYVLNRFAPEEVPVISDAVNTCTAAVNCLITEGVSKAMNLYNR